MGTIIVNVCWSTNSGLYVIVFHSVGQDNLGHRIADKPRVFTDSVLHHAPYVKTGRGRSKRMHTTSTKKKKKILCVLGVIGQQKKYGKCTAHMKMLRVCGHWMEAVY